MILAVDSATRWAGLALHNGTAVIAENCWQCLNNHTQELAPALQNMMKRVNVTPDDITAVAVAIGPGSYTGLRVGLALAKGLALTHKIPLIGVPTLDIVAANFGAMDKQLVIAIEAGRSRMTAAGYQWQNKHGWQVQWGPKNGTWEELLTPLSGKTLFAGELTAERVKVLRRMNDQFQAATPAFSVRRPAVLAEIGWRRLHAGQTDAAEHLTPIYMRDPAGN